MQMRITKPVILAVVGSCSSFLKITTRWVEAAAVLLNAESW